MFQQARIKLTLWYVVIIMIISSLFSGLIYHRVSLDIEQGFRRGINRLKVEQVFQQLNITPPPPGPLHKQMIDQQLQNADFFLEDINQAKQHLFTTIITINGAILLISAGLSYYLAGVTLRPIKKAYQQQKQFVADASHELKTPITALKTSLEVSLMDKKLPKAAQKVLKENLQDVQNLQSLTQYLLKLANQEVSSKLFTQVNIYDQAEKAVKQLRPLADQKQQIITLKSKYLNTTISADENSIFELFLIFLDNAIKYTPDKGSITIKLTRLKKHLKITIQDTGIGIKTENISHIFDRFFQEDASRSKQTDAGFGLGLSVARQIIEQHKGIVDVKSVKDEGTTFTIKLPR